MYTIYRKKYYKTQAKIGIIGCIFFCSCLLCLLWAPDAFSVVFCMLIIVLFHVIATLYYLRKYLNKDLDYLVLRIDDDGLFLCDKKDEGICIPWERIRHVIFVWNISGSTMIVRLFNKETYELHLSPYFYFYINFKPQKAIDAAYKHADIRKKVKVINDVLSVDYDYYIYEIFEAEKKEREKIEREARKTKKKKK